MKLRKWQYLLLFFLIVLVCGICGLIVIITRTYLDLHVIPFQPTSSGSFPKEANWIFTANEEISSTPVVTDSLAILRTPNSILAIDASTGDKVWEMHSFIPHYPSSDITIAPTIAGDRVIAPEEYSTLSAFSLSTGERLWKSQQILANPQDLHLYDIKSYTVNGNKVYVARRSWALSTYDSEISGDLLWEVDIPNRSSPIVKANSTCAYLGINTSIQCIDPRTGKQVWEKDLGAYISQLFLDENIVYISLFDGPTKLVALDLDTLQSNWSITSVDLPEEKLFALYPIGDNLYAGGEKLYKISKENGEILWASDEIGWLETPLVPRFACLCQE